MQRVRMLCFIAVYFTDRYVTAQQVVVNIPEQQRVEYATYFESFMRLVRDMDSKLNLFALLFKEDAVKRVIEIVRGLPRFSVVRRC